MMWNDILLTVISVALPALVGYGLKLLGAYLNTKTNSVKLQYAFGRAGDMVESVVAQTSQTFCDTLKGTPDWNAQTMKNAFSQSARKAKELISVDVQQLIQSETGNFDSWLEARIEQAVRNKR